MKAAKISRKLAKELAEIEDDIRNNRNLSPSFTNAKDAIAYLNSHKK